MNGSLNNNDNLVMFLNKLFQNENLTDKAPLIMKFFIITRDFGLKDIQENINKIMNNYNFLSLCLETIQNGFHEQGIEFNNENLINFLITNYHDNGFYFHSFPGIYFNSIKERGILANNRNENDNRYYQIVAKYHFGEYFKSADNRVCVSEKISNFGTVEYAIFTPEWLEMFLKQGNDDIHEAFKNGDVDEILKLADNSLSFFKEGMQRNPLYDENDFIFLENYIKDIISKRFMAGNNKVGIALIEKSDADTFFGKHIKKEDIPQFSEYIKARNMKEKDIFDFIIETLSKGEKVSSNSIPNHMLKLITYNLDKPKEKLDKTTK